MKISEKIIYLRKKNGWSQEQLSIKLDISRQAVYKWEAGISLPEIDKLKKLSKIFKVSYNDLLDDEIDIISKIEQTGVADAPLNINEEENASSIEKEALENSLTSDVGVSCSSDDSSNARSNPHRSSKNRVLVIAIAIALSLAILGAIIGLCVYFSTNGHFDSEGEKSSSSSSYITLMKNDGTNEQAQLSFENGIAILKNPFESDKNLIGWSSSADGKGDMYAPNKKISDTLSHKTLYAIWGKGKFEFIECDGGYSLNKYTGLDFEEVTIPSTYKGKSVVKIEPDAFKGTPFATSIAIPQGVVSIDDGTFYACVNLESLKIPSSVTSIDASAFRGCASLKSFIVDDANEYFAEVNGILFNKEKTRLKKYPVGRTNTTVNVPAGTHYIDDHAFEDCVNMTACILPNGVGGIGSYAFNSCINLKSIELGDRIDYVGSKAFIDCSSLNEIAFSHDLYSIGNYAFSGCSNLQSVDLQNTGEIGFRAFYNCLSLTDVFCFGEITKQDKDAFEGCKKFNGVSYPSAGCTHAEIIYHDEEPATCSSEGSSAWSECAVCFQIITPPTILEATDHIEKIVKGVVPTCLNSGTSDYKICSICELLLEKATPIKATGHTYIDGVCKSCSFLKSNETLEYKLVGDSTGGYYEVIGIGTCTGNELTIPSEYNSLPVKKIGNFALNNAEFSKIIIPNTITTIGQYSFQSCSNLEELDLPNSVTKIESCAFSYCTSLKAINLSTSLSEIDVYAFEGCEAIDTVTYASDLKDWCDIVFKNNLSNPIYYSKELMINGSKLTDLVISSDITKIGQYCFAGYDGLKSVSLNSLQSIDNNAFLDCNALSTVTIGIGVKNISYNAFKGCDAIDKVNYLGSVATWCDIELSNEFSNPTYYSKGLYINDVLLTDLVIPDAIEQIGAYAFIRCNSLNSISLPNNLVSIGSYAFNNCANVKTIYYNAKKMADFSARNHVFENIGGSINGVSVTIGKDVLSLPDYLFCPSLDNSNSTSCVKEIIFEQDSSCSTIGKGAFADCYLLASISLPSALKTLGESAFEDCTSLSEIKINSQSIDDLSANNCVFKNAGSNSDGITVKISNSVSRIPKYLFCPMKDDSSCSPNITKVYFENHSSGATMGENAFLNCSKICYVDIYSIESWLKMSFENCYANPSAYSYNVHLNESAIAELVVPDGSERINNYAFYNCSSITSVYVAESVNYFGVYSFYGCYRLSSVTFEATDGWYEVGSFSTSELDVTNPNLFEYIRIGNRFYYQRITE